MLRNNLCAPSWVHLCSSPVGRPSTSYPASRSRERCWRTSRESSRLSVGPGEKGHMMKTRWLWYFLYTRKSCPKSLHIFKSCPKVGIHFRGSIHRTRILFHRGLYLRPHSSICGTYCLTWVIPLAIAVLKTAIREMLSIAATVTVRGNDLTPMKP